MTKELKIGFVLDLHGKVNNPISRMDNYCESILKKVEYILKENDIIIFCGDILNTYLTGIEFINKLLQLLVQYETQGKVIKVILGNHDIIGRNYDTYKDTSIGTILLGRNWLLQDTIYSTKYFRIIPLTFKDEEPVIPKFVKDDAINILVGHAYFNHPEFNDTWNIDESLLKNFDYCILGHDHQQYPIEEYFDCKLLRSGGISRTTIEDKDREIKYPQIVFYKENTKIQSSCFYQDVPYKPKEEVFKLEDISSKELQKHKKDVDKMIELLTIEDKDTSKLSVIGILEEVVKCPEKYLRIIKDILYE